MEIVEGVFACLHRGQGLLMLRLTRGDGSPLDPAQEGFRMWNHTWNQYNKAGGGGDEVYFVVLKADHYSLRHHDHEVWTYGESMDMTAGPSSVNEFSRFSQSPCPKGCFHRRQRYGSVDTILPITHGLHI